MKLLILEDEPAAASGLLAILNNKLPNVEIVRVIPSKREARSFLNHNDDFHIILSDIQLSDGLSLDLFSEKEILKPIVFITAYDEYLFDSFDHNCINYILKPINEKKLLKALNKADKLLMQSKNQVFDTDLLNGLKNLYHQDKYKKRFLCKIGNRIVFKSPEEIAYFFIENKLTYLIDAASGKKFLVNCSLDELESELLDPMKFFRINRSIIVNLDYLIEMKKISNGRLQLYIKSMRDIDPVVARDRVVNFKNWISQ